LSDHDDGPARASSKTDRLRRPDGLKASSKVGSAKPEAAKAGAKPVSGAPEKKAGASERRPGTSTKPSSSRTAEGKTTDEKKPSGDAKPARAGGTTRSAKRPDADAPAEEASPRKAGAVSTRAKPDKADRATAAKAEPANGAGDRDRASRRAPAKSDRVAREMEQVDLGAPPTLPRVGSAKTAGKTTPDKAAKGSSRKRPASPEEDEPVSEDRPLDEDDPPADEVDSEDADHDEGMDDEAPTGDEDLAMNDDAPKAKKSGAPKPKGEGGPPPKKKPHPLFMFLLLGVPAIGIGVMAYLRWDELQEWLDPKPPAPPERIVEKSDTLVKWEELRKRTDALSQNLALVMKKKTEAEDKLAKNEEVDFAPLLADFDQLDQEAKDCDSVCNALVAGIQADAKLATLDDARERARKMNTKDGSNIGSVIDAVAQRIQDIGTQRRSVLEMKKEIEGAKGSGKGSNKPDDSVVPGMGSGSEKN